MKLIEKIKQIERLDILIRRKATGTPKELAQKLGVSERCIYDLIKSMKAMNAPIIYDHHRQSYRYDAEVSFFFGFLDSDHLSGLRGGNRKNLSPFGTLQDFCSSQFYLASVNGH